MDTCPHCSLTYDAFRGVSVGSYKDAYHQIAWTREHTSRTAVLGHWGRAKRHDWSAHLEECQASADEAAEAGPMPEDGDADFDPSQWGWTPADRDASNEWGAPDENGPASLPECPRSHGNTQEAASTRMEGERSAAGGVDGEAPERSEGPSGAPTGHRGPLMRPSGQWAPLRPQRSARPSPAPRSGGNGRNDWPQTRGKRGSRELMGRFWRRSTGAPSRPNARGPPPVPDPAGFGHVAALS